ncbi:major facilitator superfamily protein [Cupriavidus basilensis OR16]|uniref:Major facilitator superfamily protein n=1 Tax=Cupriavidus basilensis OR16 TaxID=1127483 RepID=H1RXW2_9BURK|nr:MFS transporter [Cupriavidus basilensis]EHP44937.1 major facilitator superfamily protein [Cupriavidus basilensis OR16]
MARVNVFPGWYVVGATHVLLALIFGAAYSFGAFFASIQEGFRVGSSSAASVFSFTALIYYVVGVFSGSLADRISTRRVIATGIVLLALGFAIASLVTDSLAWFLIAFCSLVGLGVGLVYVPAVTAVQRWFVRHRSRASGLALAGTGLGTFVGPVVAGLLMEHMSWQATMRCFALAIAVAGLAMAMLLRGRPEEAGLHPDGALVAHGAAQAPAPRGLSLAQAVRGGRFWWYFGAILLGSVGLFAALVHIHPYARQHGMSSTAGNLLIGLVGAGNILGRLLLGGLGDRLGPGRLLVCLTLMLALLNGVWLGGTGLPCAGAVCRPVRRGQRRLHLLVPGARRDLVRHRKPRGDPGGAVHRGGHCRDGGRQPRRLALRCLRQLLDGDCGERMLCATVGRLHCTCKPP